jgi:(p)ppGpp synthase/HD superfamily hydrolase
MIVNEFLEKSNAKMLAEFLHAKQTYDDQDYIYHIDMVVCVLERFGIYDEDLIIAAYLHDSVEDTSASLKLIEKYFGIEVMRIVNAVTNEQGLNRKERNLKTYQKLMQNKRAIIVKLADRIANVEQALLKGNMRFFKMYADEYPGFKYYLRGVSTEQAKPLWEHLDKLFETK